MHDSRFVFVKYLFGVILLYTYTSLRCQYSVPQNAYTPIVPSPLFQRLLPSTSPFPPAASVVCPPSRSFSSVTDVCFVKYGDGSRTKVASMHAMIPNGIEASHVILKASL